MKGPISWVFCVLICFTPLSQQCSNGYPYEKYLATKTPYRLVSNNSLHKVQYEACTPKKAWMLVRHGTRNPSDKIIELMNSRLPEIQKLIINSKSLPDDLIKNRDLDLFRKWKSHLDISNNNKLTHEGEEEMLLLAERMQSRFPEVFDAVYSNTSYKLKYTHSQRTKKSAYYFAAGLFGKKTAKDVWFPEPLKKDPILRFYKLCKKWNIDVKAKVEQSGEHKKFQNTPALLKLVKDINKRLGLTNELNINDVSVMYMMCAFETAWNKRTKSPWCSPFTEDEFKLLEYMQDLKYYWQDGYGYQLTFKQACPTFGDMIEHFDWNSNSPKTTLYFTHSGTLLKMLAHLGLYKDNVPLTADNYSNMSGRKWRTSLIDSFATNLAFILYDCNGTKKVLALHQENVMRLPSCPDVDLCDFSKMQRYYRDSIESCDFNSMCDVSDSYESE